MSYPYQVRFDTNHVAGNLKGLVTQDGYGLVSPADAPAEGHKVVVGGQVVRVWTNVRVVPTAETLLKRGERAAALANLIGA